MLKKTFLITMFVVPISISAIDKKQLDLLWQLIEMNNPQLISQKFLQTAARARFQSESMFETNPEISLGLNNVPTSSFPRIDKDSMSSYSLGISQKISLPWNVTARKSIMEQESLAVEQEVETVKRQLYFELKQIYYTIQFLNGKAKILEGSLAALKSLIQAARSKVAVNLISAALLLKMEADLSVAMNLQLNNEAMLNKEVYMLKALCNSDLKKEQYILENFDTESILKLDINKLGSSFSVVDHPQYKKMQFMLNLAKAKSSYEKSQFLPEIMLMAEYMMRQKSSMADGEDMLSFKITAPLPLFYFSKEKNKITEKENEVGAASQSLTQMEIMLTSEWLTLLNMLKNNISALRNFEEQILPRYTAAYEVMLGSLASSSTDLSEVLDAYRMSLQMKLEKAELTKETLSILAKLEYLSKKIEY